MEPRQYKLLAEILLITGIIFAAIGAACIYFLSENLIGALLMILGCGMSLISLPTFMILMMLTSAKIIPK